MNRNSLIFEKTIPEMKLYGINENNNEKYFNSRAQLRKYCQRHKISMDDMFVLEYIRYFANRSDVIKKTSSNGLSIFYTVSNEYGYEVYNHEKSLKEKNYVWEFNYGEIEEMYNIFRNRGIIFENDVYGRIEENHKLVLKTNLGKVLFDIEKKSSN